MNTSRLFSVTAAAAAIVALAVPLQAQRYGGPVAASGDQLIVGEAANQTLPGVVYLYGQSGGEWVDQGRLMLGDEVGPPDGFGRAVAATDDVLLVGAPMYDEGRGLVIAYQRDGDGWAEVARFASADADGSAGFGGAIALDGDRAIVSAPGQGDGRGAAYVFGRAADGTWTEVAALSGPADQAGRGFGASVALDGGSALVSTALGRNQPGLVYAFRSTGAGFTLESELIASETAPVGYGSAIDLMGTTALVGASGVADRTGAVFVFQRGEDGWSPAGTLSPFHGQRRAQFGSAIGHDGQATWIGAPGEAGGAGAVYEFTRDGEGAWSGVQRRVAGVPDGAPGFGSSIAVGSGAAVIGAGNVDSRAGGAVIVTRDGGAWGAETLVRGDHRSFPAVTGEEVECSDGEAAGFECSNVNVVAYLPIKDIGGARGTMVNDIWGWTDPVTAKEYAIIGRTDGTSFVDVTDPYNPVYKGDLPKTEGSRSSIWRDMKVYKDHAYIVADAAGAHGMQVFDLTQLRDVGADPVTFEETFLYDEINSAHNIVINEETGFGYAVGSSGGGTTCGGGLHMIALEDPANPSFEGCFFDVTTGRSKTGYSHDAQCVVYRGPDEEHQGKEICLGSNETALSIADVTDKQNPVAISVITYPNVAYAHQGWLTEDHRYFYMNDEGDEPSGLVDGTRTLVWDVMDLDDPVLVKEHIAETTDTDHNLYVIGDRMYQSNYGAGLRVFDVSDPANPVEIGHFDTTPYGGGGSWSNYPYFKSGMIVTTSMGDGLFVLKSTGRRELIP